VTPFENGRPRRHTRLFSRADLDVTVLVGELFVPPMASPALADAIVECGLDSSLDVCTYITPVHAQAPDIEAAIRLVETVAAVYDLGIDPAPLEAFAAEVEQYYAGLAERLEERDLSPDDRMYM